MKLEPGRMLANYRLVEKIGEGGMGVVWKALDTTLDREVAVKILPDALARFPDRLERFEREARVLASFQHPNIAVLHGLHEFEGVRFLVMEHVSGEDLARRLERGPLPVPDALKLCTQIARALEAAHARGIVHRDLKPANVVVSASGEAKVLDFGLAKVLEPEHPAGSLGDPGHSPTVTSGGTIAGVLLGTAAYMSPEQARAKMTDRRTDVWSFGCVLLECLTGKAQFGGESVSDSIGAVLHKDPDWKALPPDVPPTIRLLLHRCLTKDRDSRLHDIADARIELERALQDPAGSDLGIASSEAQTPGRPRATWWVGAVVVVAAVAAATWVLKPAPVAARRVVKLSAELPAPQEDLAFALSPDGSMLVYSATDPEKKKEGGSDERRLWIRRLDSFQVTPIPGTEGGNFPQFSPDGRVLAFVADDPRATGHEATLRVVTLDGRPPLTLAKNAVDHNRPVWLSNDEIAFLDGKKESEFFVVSRAGGEPRSLARADNAERTRYFDLAAVPGVPLLAIPWRRGAAMIVSLLDTRTGREVDLLQDAENPRFTADGTLLFLRGSTLLATGIDLSSDPPVLAGEVETIMGGEADGIDAFEISEAGHLAFLLDTTSKDGTALMTLDDTGQVAPFTPERRPYSIVHPLSPDGRRIAFSQRTQEDLVGVWVMELDTKAARPVAPDIQPAAGGAWTDDGRLLFTAWDRALPRILVSEMRANAEAEPLFADWSEDLRISASWLATDGKNVLFTAALAERGDTDVWIRPLDGAEPARPLIGTKASEGVAALSPDRRWLAFQSDESGRHEVYVRAHDLAGTSESPAVRVSRSGGRSPLWSHDGRALYFLDEPGRELLAVEVGSAGRIAAGEPRTIADLEALRVTEFFTMMPFQPLADGRLLFVQGEGPGEGAERIEIVLNWTAQLGR